MTAIDTSKIADRSPFHAMAVVLVTQMQQGLERQRRIWTLRAKVEEHRHNLEQTMAALAIEESEQELERKLAEHTMDMIEAKAEAFALSTRKEGEAA